MSIPRLATVTLALAIALAGWGCPSRAAAEADPLFDVPTEESEPADGFPDPIEPFNRGVLSFNEYVDRFALDPITRAYRFIAPQPFKRGMRNLFSNLNTPVVFGNDILQGEFRDAGITYWRFVVNTIVGVGGLIDVAEYLDVEGHSSDFDQTMAVWGVPSGPFLILPVLGPTTARGMTGLFVDLMFRPTAYLLGPADQLTFGIIHGGSAGLSLREKALDDLQALKDSSVDYYAALRNAYYQNRNAEIWRRKRPVEE